MPFGEEEREARADARSALLGLRICQVLGAKDLELEDFMLEWGPEDEPDEALEAAVAKTQLERLAMALGAEVVRTDGR